MKDNIRMKLIKTLLEQIIYNKIKCYLEVSITTDGEIRIITTEEETGIIITIIIMKEVLEDNNNIIIKIIKGIINKGIITIDHNNNNI